MSKLIYLMGPSGCGKDTLIHALREQPPEALMFAHRYVTRPWQAGNENHIELSPAEFQQRKASGLFCLHWSANDHHYGIGCEVNEWLAAGHSVLINGSREHLPEAIAAFPTQILPVLIQVDEERLRQRLLERGRESAEAIEQRLARSRQLMDALPCDYYSIDNNGRLEDALRSLSQLLHQ